MYVLCTRMTSSARNPTKATGGCDIYSCETLKFEPGQRLLINTGVSFKFPDGYYGTIVPSSYITLMKRLDVIADVLNFDDRYQVCICAQNNTNESINIEPGDKIARMLFCKETPATLLNLRF